MRTGSYVHHQLDRGSAPDPGSVARGGPTGTPARVPRWGPRQPRAAPSQARCARLGPLYGNENKILVRRRIAVQLHRMGAASLGVAAALALTSGCGAQTSPTSPTIVSGSNTAAAATVRFVYRAATSPRTDLPASAQSCVQGVGRTHIHPSWRSFNRIDMTPVGADRWEITFNDVPTNARQEIRVSDGNVCDENPTGAATRSVFANDVLLVEIVPTPGSGIEPGLAFTVSSDGRVTP